MPTETRTFAAAEPERTAGLDAIDWAKKLEIDAVAQDDDAIWRDAEPPHFLLERLRDGDDASRRARGGLDEPAAVPQAVRCG